VPPVGQAGPRDLRAGVNVGRGGDHQDPGLDRLRRRYPRWRIWRGAATGRYWALPPPDHPTGQNLVGAGDLGELARLLAQAEGWYGL
jgi:hypothetical protein